MKKFNKAWIVLLLELEGVQCSLPQYLFFAVYWLCILIKPISALYCLSRWVMKHFWFFTQSNKIKRWGTSKKISEVYLKYFFRFELVRNCISFQYQLSDHLYINKVQWYCILEGLFYLPSLYEPAYLVPVQVQCSTTVLQYYTQLEQEQRRNNLCSQRALNLGPMSALSNILHHFSYSQYNWILIE